MAEQNAQMITTEDMANQCVNAVREKISDLDTLNIMVTKTSHMKSGSKAA